MDFPQLASTAQQDFLWLCSPVLLMGGEGGGSEALGKNRGRPTCGFNSDGSVLAQLAQNPASNIYLASNKPNIAVYTYNPSTREMEERRSEFPGPSWLCSEL